MPYNLLMFDFSLVNAQFTPMEILWTFSVYLEAVAILPQLFMLQRRGEAETITGYQTRHSLYVFTY